MASQRGQRGADVDHYLLSYGTSPRSHGPEAKADNAQA